MAVSLVDLGIEHGFDVSSILEFQATFNTAKTGGVVFDYYGPDNFKFAAIDACQPSRDRPLHGQERAG
jgi:hypothetical protein